MITFKRLVSVRADHSQGACFYVHADEAERIYRAGQAMFRFGKFLVHISDESAVAKKKQVNVEELLLPDFHPRSEGRVFSSNSLIPGGIQSLPGGSVLELDRQHPRRPTRVIETEPCRVYRLKTIHDSCWPIYRAALLEHLAPFRAPMPVPIRFT